MPLTALVILVNLSLRALICLDLLVMTESFSERRSRSSFLEAEDVRDRRCLRLWISRLSWNIWSLYRAADVDVDVDVDDAADVDDDPGPDADDEDGAEM